MDDPHVAPILKKDGPLEAMARVLAVLALWICHTVLLEAVVGMALLPPLCARFLTREGASALGRPVEVGALAFNPFTFAFTAKDLRVGDGSGGELAGFALLDVDLDPLLLFARRAAVSRFVLKDPVLVLSRDASGRLDVQDILERLGSAPGGAGGFPFRLGFSLRDVRVTGGRLVFDDALAGRRQEATGLSFSLDSAESGRPGIADLFTSSGRINGSDMTLDVKADLSGKGFMAEARAELSGISLGNYTPYILPLKKALDVRVEKAALTARLALPGDAPASLACDADITGVSLRDGEAEVFQTPHLSVTGAALTPDGKGVRVEAVALSAPSVHVSRDTTGIVGIIDLLEPVSGEGTDKKADTPASAPPVSVGLVTVSDGRAVMYDAGLDMSLTLEQIEAALKGLDLQAKRFGSLEVTAVSDNFESLTASCSGAYSPLAVTGKAALAGVDLAKPLPTLRRLLPRLGLAGRGTFTAGFTLKDKDGLLSPSVVAGMRLDGLKVLAEGQALPVVVANRVEVERFGFDGDSGNLGVGQVTLTKGEAALERDLKGDFPARYAFVPPNLHQEGTKSTVWAATVARMALNGFGLTYVDKAAKTKASAFVDQLSVTDFASGLDKPFSLSARGTLLDSAPFEVSGQVRPDDRSLALNIRVKDLPVGRVASLLPGLEAMPGSGLASLSGKLDASLGKAGLKAGFEGDAGVSLLKFVRQGRTRAWASATGVTVTGLSASLAPLSVSAKSVVVDEPWARVLVDENGKPRLPGLDFAEAKPGEKKDYALSQVAYRLDKVEVRRGWLEIVARGFEPPLEWLLSGIEGTFDGVRPGQPATFSLSMVTGHTGSLKAQGLAGWAAGSPLLDFKAALTNMDLGELSPVSRRFTGFPILRGMLGLKLDYKATPKTLDLKNNIVVTGIQLGPKQPGPETRDIPLDLAVSLLTDSHGVIDLDIPVSGDPGAAKADLKDVISTAMSGAFAKVITAPFAVLDVSRQHGQTLYIPFEPGGANLSPEARESLDALGKAMKERPRLSLEVAAFVDKTGEAAAFGKALADPSEGTPGRRLRAVWNRVLSPDGTATPTARDWLRLARLRQNVVLDYLSGKDDIPRDRVFPLAVTSDGLDAPAAQGQAGSRAEVRLRW